jgi:phosphatidylserine/phosphatidylglycerophosphate/cardiolipin synthase-like enzyme
MNDDALLELPAHLRDRLRAALESGLLPLPTNPFAVQAAAGTDREAPSVVEALNTLHARGLDVLAIAALLRAADRLEARQQRPDLVWSGPSAPGVPARDTRQVIEELIRGATSTLWISSYAYFDGPRAFAAIAERMTAEPALGVRLLLNVPRPRGDTSAPDALISRFAHQFWTRDWPGDRRPEVYYAPAALGIAGLKGVLHAKVVVADEQRLFVTSANLTEAAFDRNIEAGLLVRDAALAKGMVRHFAGLIEHGELARLPVLTRAI